MAYVGQPVPSTVSNVNTAKVSDGKSVRVTVPENTVIEAGKFYLLDGFLGAAFQSVTTGVEETAEVILNIEQAEYETDQTKTNDRASMTVGKDIYWDKNNKYFTLSATDIYAGKITSAADSNGVIWFKLFQRPWETDDVAALSAKIGDIAALETEDKTDVVTAINELAEKVADNVEKVADVDSLSISDADGLKAVATKLNAVIDALVTAGLMAADK